MAAGRTGSKEVGGDRNSSRVGHVRKYVGHSISQGAAVSQLTLTDLLQNGCLVPGKRLHLHLDNLPHPRA